MPRIILEICVDDAAGIYAAVNGGANRIELCAALGLGGLTPSAGLMALAAECAIPTMAMIRPRGGDFVWSRAEMRAMCVEINAMRAASMGVYQNDFWVQIGITLAFIVPFVIMGILRPVLSRFTYWFVEQVEKSKVVA